MVHALSTSRRLLGSDESSRDELVLALLDTARSEDLDREAKESLAMEACRLVVISDTMGTRG